MGRSVAATFVVILILAAAVGLLAASVWYREAYALWPGQQVPTRIRWCGRDYDKSPDRSLTLAQAQSVPGGRGAEGWRSL